jgi:predicted 3-demethylubiquinone-9 3-methyltransferase (glyoxalase superfamily)
MQKLTPFLWFDDRAEEQRRSTFQIQRIDLVCRELRNTGESGLFLGTLTANGGEKSAYGWLKDRFGLSWQAVPTVLIDMLHDPDSAKSGRVMESMLEMKKIDIKTLKDAYER